MRVRSLIADGPSSIGARARQSRWNLLGRTFPDLESLRVLDLGGTAYSWLACPVRPKSVTLLNLHGAELTVRHENEELPEWFSLAAGDACDPPAEIRSNGYDLIFCNSLIEHVGGASRRRLLADFIRESSPRYWVQTPYRYFPIEPHWIFPGFQFLPLSTRAALSRRWPLMHTRAADWRGGVEAALDVELLSLTELHYLFPDAAVAKERFAGLTKSIVAYRT
ncbi:MAG TPA: class I SAM-dependent methyltransferase [Pseudonocardia sp.]|jgi:hypothetical protein